MNARTWRLIGRAAVPAFAVGGLMSPVSATTPSLFGAPYNRIVVDCSEVSPAIADSICKVVADELRSHSKVPVVIGKTANAADIVVNLRAQSAQHTAQNLDLAIWLSRPVGRNGEPVVKPVKSASLPLTKDGKLANARPAVRQALQQVFRWGPRFARVPSPPRAQ